ncbi:MAG: divalent-cation tolerance protein CutA [Pseudomonadota bacterium]
MPAAVVYITVPDLAEAERIGNLLLEKRLAACVNILEGMTSIYWWKGKMEQARETIVLAKTKSRLVDELSAFVGSTHPYDCPCVIAVPLIGGNPEFLKWIEDETK